MSTGVFLSVAIPGLKTPWAVYSAQHPAVLIDVILRPAPADDQHPPGTMNACLQVRNAPPGTLRPAVAEAARVYGKVTTLDMDEAKGQWLGTYTTLPPKLPDPSAVAIFGFLKEHGFSLHWVRVQDGVAYWRCEVPSNKSARAVETGLRQFLASRHIVADTALADADEAELTRAAELDDLVKAMKA